MTPVLLRLATLSFAIAPVSARWLRGSDHVDENWAPAKETGRSSGLAAADSLDPFAARAPNPTPAPTPPSSISSIWSPIDLRRRQESEQFVGNASQTCGYPVDFSSLPPFVCEGQETCTLNRHNGIVGCCDATTGCRIPTACVESTQTEDAFPGDPSTITCTDPARPSCLTYVYDVPFFENLSKASILQCAEEGGVATILTTPPPGSNLTSSSSSSSASSTPSTTNSLSTSSASSTGSGMGASSTPTSGADGSGSGGTKNIGAIVGGTLGGVAGAALLAAAILFCLRRRKRNQFQEPPLKSYEPEPDPRSSVYPSAPPDSHFHSTFYGEVPQEMGQQAPEHNYLTGYAQPGAAGTATLARDNGSSLAPSSFLAITPHHEDDHDFVSPITPTSNAHLEDPDTAYNTMVSNLSSPPQSHYNQYSPPPPQRYQSYQPYPGT
ncbi:hypothetical protein F4778DRAFT_779974 [Xylariomycetidae sp. FL2044]|nr:hypothetical protein F4778DRAFT_779974 [Xylariomycetidae sp. FL2044]